MQKQYLKISQKHLSEGEKKLILLKIVIEILGDENSYEKDLKNSIKNRLEKDIDNYSIKDLEGFKILLDKLISIIENKEDIEILM